MSKLVGTNADMRNGRLIGSFVSGWMEELTTEEEIILELQLESRGMHSPWTTYAA